MFEAAKTLDHMINHEKLKVYVHCTAGMGRAPACVLAYLCLFKRIDCWHDPEAVRFYVKT
jgi:protein-tyrosine phosphatase